MHPSIRSLEERRVQSAGMAFALLACALYLAGEIAPFVLGTADLKGGALVLRDAHPSSLVVPPPGASLTRPWGLGETAAAPSKVSGSASELRVHDAAAVEGLGARKDWDGLGEPEPQPGFMPPYRGAQLKSGLTTSSPRRAFFAPAFSAAPDGGSSGAFLSPEKNSTLGQAGRRLASGIESAVKALVRTAVAVLPQPGRKASSGDVSAQPGGRESIGAVAQAATLPAGGPALQTASAGPAGSALSAPAAVDAIAAVFPGKLSETSSVKDVQDVTPRPERDDGGGGLGFGDVVCYDYDDSESFLESLGPEATDAGFGACAGFAAGGGARCRALACGARDAAIIARTVATAYEEAAGGLRRLLGIVGQSLDERITADEATAAELYRWRRDVTGNIQLHGCVYGAANAIKNRVAWLKGYRQALGEAIAGLERVGPEASALPSSWRAAALGAVEHEEAIVNDLGVLVKEAKSYAGTCTTGIPDQLPDRRHGSVPYPAGQEAKQAFKALMDSFNAKQGAILASFEPGWCRRGRCVIPDLAPARRLIGLHQESREEFSDVVDAGMGRGIQEADALLEQAGRLFETPEKDRGRNYIQGVFLLGEAARASELGAADWRRPGVSFCPAPRRCIQRSRAASSGDRSLRENLARRGGLTIDELRELIR